MSHTWLAPKSRISTFPWKCGFKSSESGTKILLHRLLVVLQPSEVVTGNIGSCKIDMIQGGQWEPIDLGTNGSMLSRAVNTYCCINFQFCDKSFISATPRWSSIARLFSVFQTARSSFSQSQIKYGELESMTWLVNKANVGQFLNTWSQVAHWIWPPLGFTSSNSSFRNAIFRDL